MFWDGDRPAGRVVRDAQALPVFMTEGAQTGGEMRYPIPATDSVNVDRTAQLIVARSQGHVTCSRFHVRTRTTP